MYFCHYLQIRYFFRKKKTDVLAVDITNAFDYRIYDLQQKNSFDIFTNLHFSVVFLAIVNNNHYELIMVSFFIFIDFGQILHLVFGFVLTT